MFTLGGGVPTETFLAIWILGGKTQGLLPCFSSFRPQDTLEDFWPQVQMPLAQLDPAVISDEAVDEYSTLSWKAGLIGSIHWIQQQQVLRRIYIVFSLFKQSFYVVVLGGGGSFCPFLLEQTGKCLLNVLFFFLSKKLILSNFLTNPFLRTGLEGNTFEPLERSLNDSW